jgi:uncharacterized protein (TIGR02421 family)
VSFESSDLAIDRRLSSLARSLPFLLLISPTNTAECKRRYLSGDHREPKFEYRPIPDLAPYHRQLEAIDVDATRHPTLRHLFSALRRDLELRIDMLEVRGGNRFHEAGIELFGHVESDLEEIASAILTTHGPDGSNGRSIAGEALARRFAAELDYYRALDPSIASIVQLRDDTTSLLVSNGDLFIGSSVRMREDDVAKLAHHEVGVHILTHVNGSAQPLSVLGTGLAHYDELQEALGLIAEYLVGGLPPRRLRVLAARVVAAAHLGDDDDFAATFGRLRDLSLTPGASFATTMRVRRSGGLTKDAIYLRGLGRLVEHLGAGGRLEPLFVGKASLEDMPLLQDLIDRGQLKQPKLLPRLLQMESARERLRGLQRGLDLAHIGGLST